MVPFTGMRKVVEEMQEKQTLGAKSRILISNVRELDVGKYLQNLSSYLRYLIDMISFHHVISGEPFSPALGLMKLKY